MSDLSARLRAIASAHAVLGHELHRSDRQWQQDAAVTLLDAADRLEQLAQMTAERDEALEAVGVSETQRLADALAERDNLGYEVDRLNKLGETWADYVALKQRCDTAEAHVVRLQRAVEALLAHPFATECQECAIGRSEAWKAAVAALPDGPDRSTKKREHDSA